MEKMMMKVPHEYSSSCNPSSSSASNFNSNSKVGMGKGMNKGSHIISKTTSSTKPKIRITHVFAPEIIKTDVANFRELVQNLTGKPHDDNKTILRTSPTSTPTVPTKKSMEELQNRDDHERILLKEEMLQDHYMMRRSSPSSDSGSGTHHHHQIQKINNGNFLDGFSDLEYGFDIEDLSNGFPSLHASMHHDQ